VRQTKSARQIGSQIRKPSSQRFSKSGMLCWVNRTNLNSSGRRLRSAGAEAAYFVELDADGKRSLGEWSSSVQVDNWVAQLLGAEARTVQ